MLGPSLTEFSFYLHEVMSVICIYISLGIRIEMRHFCTQILCNTIKHYLLDCIQLISFDMIKPLFVSLISAVFQRSFRLRFLFFLTLTIFPFIPISPFSNMLMRLIFPVYGMVKAVLFVCSDILK